MIKVLQANLKRMRVAHDVVFVEAAKNKVNIILASEPNKVLARKGRWVTDRNEDVAIYIRNKRLQGPEEKAGIPKAGGRGGDFPVWLLLSERPREVAEQFLDRIFDDAAGTRGEKIILGDMNAKAAQWGSPVTDRRGELLLEYIEAADMLIQNQGDTPTFQRGSSSSFIDVTLASSGLANRVLNWRVSLDEPMSDHRHILFEVACPGTSLLPVGTRSKEALNKTVLREELTWRLAGEAARGPTKIREQLRAAQVAATRRTPLGGADVMPYWWSEDIENKRDECTARRRRLTRARRGREAADPDVIREEEQYKTSKKELKKMIRQSKTQHWRTLTYLDGGIK